MTHDVEVEITFDTSRLEAAFRRLVAEQVEREARRRAARALRDMRALYATRSISHVTTTKETDMADQPTDAPEEGDGYTAADLDKAQEQDLLLAYDGEDDETDDNEGPDDIDPAEDETEETA